MEWRIILPVLCLIAITSPTSVMSQTTMNKVAKINLRFSIAQEFKDFYNDVNNTETKNLTANITSEVSRVYKSQFETFVGMNIRKLSNGSIMVDSVLDFNTTNGTAPNVTVVKETLVTAIRNANFSFNINNATINATDVTEASATTSPPPVTNQTTPAKVAKVNLGFSITQEFKAIYSDFNNAETKSLTNNITNEFSKVYKRRFANFFRMVIQKFSQGSILVDSVLEFDATNGSAPNATDVKDTLVAAINNGSFTFPVSNTSINVSVVPDTSAITSPPPVTNQTTPAKVAKVNLSFSITQEFKAIYNDLNNAETKSLTNNITNEFSKVYKRRFANFFRMVIRKFSQGSILVDSDLEFDATNGSAPNAMDVKDTLVAAINNGSFSFPVSNTSINVSVVPDTNVTTTTLTPASAASADYNITFKLNDQFKTELSDMSSNAATNLTLNVTTELNGFYRGFKNFVRSKVLRFSNGSIVVDGQLAFNNTVANNPTVSELATGLASAVKNGTVKLAIDPASIKVTDPNGVFANRSPVLASMLTALWMTLASLLLSAVMH